MNRSILEVDEMFRLTTLADLYSLIEHKSHAQMARDLGLKEVTFNAYFSGHRFADKDSYRALKNSLLAALSNFINSSGARAARVMDHGYFMEQLIRQLYFPSKSTFGVFKKLAYNTLAGTALGFKSTLDVNGFRYKDIDEILRSFFEDGYTREIDVNRPLIIYFLRRILYRDGYTSITFKPITEGVMEVKRAEIKGQPLPLDKMLPPEIDCWLFESSFIDLKKAGVSQEQLPAEIIELKTATSIDVFLHLVNQHWFQKEGDERITVACTADLLETRARTYALTTSIIMGDD
jgi:hypothetical protein